MYCIDIVQQVFDYYLLKIYYDTLIGTHLGLEQTSMLYQRIFKCLRVGIVFAKFHDAFTSMGIGRNDIS